MKHSLPGDIERTSLAIIARELAARGIEIPPEHQAVVHRVIHATADFDYAASLRFTPGAAARGAGPQAARGAQRPPTQIGRGRGSQPPPPPPGARRGGRPPWGPAGPSSPTPIWPWPG